MFLIPSFTPLNSLHIVFFPLSTLSYIFDSNEEAGIIYHFCIINFLFLPERFVYHVSGCKTYDHSRYLKI